MILLWIASKQDASTLFQRLLAEWERGSTMATISHALSIPIYLTPVKTDLVPVEWNVEIKQLVEKKEATQSTSVGTVAVAGIALLMLLKRL
jgi:hypothetical protein